MYKRYELIKVFCFILFLFILSNSACGQDNLSPWKEFVTELKENRFSEERLRPYYDFLKEPLMGFLENMREKANWEEWEADPEIFVVGNKIHYILPLTFNNIKDNFCFTFLLEDGKWYFQHLESIYIRLDRIRELPVSNFPDIPHKKILWMKEENYTTEKVRLFNFLVKEKGKKFALD